MPHELSLLDLAKEQVVEEFFIETADDNYIVSRWCALQSMHVDFFWLAVHALEKYMKAVLLLNGQSGRIYKDTSGKTQRFGHDIVALYDQVQLIAADILPVTLTKPGNLTFSHWRKETTEQFLERLYDNGNADNRYQIYGFMRHFEDLIKFDRMVFVIRRLCRPLDAYLHGEKLSGAMYSSNREALINEPGWWELSGLGRLEKTIRGKRGDDLRDTALKENYSFVPETFKHDAHKMTLTLHGSVLDEMIIGLMDLSQDPEAQQRALDLRDWVVGNIKLPEDVKAELNDLKPKTADKD